MDEVDAAVLQFEGRWYRHGGRKVTAIYEELGMSATQYAQRLNRLADDPAAHVASPQVIGRLRRRRDVGMRARTTRRAS